MRGTRLLGSAGVDSVMGQHRYGDRDRVGSKIGYLAHSHLPWLWLYLWLWLLRRLAAHSRSWVEFEHVR